MPQREGVVVMILQEKETGTYWPADVQEGCLGRSQLVQIVLSMETQNENAHADAKNSNENGGNFNSNLYFCPSEKKME